MKFFITLMIGLVFLPEIASAESSFWVTSGFYSHHFASAQYNEDNRGVGATVAFDSGLSKHDSVSVGTYINSEYKRSNYLTYNFMPIGNDYIHGGLSVGIINGYNYKNGAYFLMAIPSLSVQYKHIGFDVVYIPKTSFFKNAPSLMAVRFKIRVW